MKLKLNKMYRIAFIAMVSVLMVANVGFAANKYASGTHTQQLTKPAGFGETVVNIGKVQNYFTNGTVTAASGNEEQSFLIGKDDLSEPSMMWLEGGYSDNHYLYFGMMRCAAKGNEIRFSTLTSEDWSVKKNDPTAVSPFDVSFSMTDALAGALEVGIWARQQVHAWSESYRDDFYIIEYDFVSTKEDIDDFYLWLHMDCDISAAAGGSGDLGFWRDDMPGYYMGTDFNGNPESLSFMYDGDNPNITGDDTQGKLSPKESTGYIGSRIIESPATSDGLVAANTQSGHQWWDWNSDPNLGGDFYNLAKKGEFKADPGSPHDYRYMQIVGPLSLPKGDTVHVAFGYGLGVGLDGLRANLQWAYDLYWNDFNGPAAPIAPSTSIEKGDGWVKIRWNNASESDLDPLSGDADFEGYRLYRSTDKTNWTLLGDFDLVDNIGENTGLPIPASDGWYEFLDEDVTNGFVYYYTVSAYDKGTADLPSLETGKTTDLFAEPGPQTSGRTLQTDKIRVVPNPFIVKAPWDFTPTNENPSEERIQFQNVPQGASVTVFNLAGDKIIKLDQEGTNGSVNWDLISRNKNKVVSGLYLYVVEASNGDTYVDKFVIVR